MGSQSLIVLDTHVWLWWSAQPTKLSAEAARAIGAARSIGIPAICCWEVAQLSVRGKVDLDREPLEWIREALADPRTTLLPLTPEIAVRSAQLADTLRGDPSDLIVVATALMEGAKLVTKDQRIQDARIVETIW